LENKISEGVNKGMNNIVSQHDNILKLIHEGVNKNVYDLINILVNVAGANAVEIASRTNRGLSHCAIPPFATKKRTS